MLPDPVRGARAVARPAVVSYSLPVSLLVDIAEKAHVSVEGVIRVLTREPVSDAIKERVLGVLDELDAEQTRVLQRFALAALHDVLPRPYEAVQVDDERTHGQEPELEPTAHPRALLPAGPEPAAEREEAAPTAAPAAAPADAAHLVQLSAVLEELAGAVRDLRQETDTERRERVDDLAVLIELISTGWQGLDRRLGRLERQLGRLETARPQTAPAPPPRQPPAPPPEPPSAAPPASPPPPPVAEPARRTQRDRLPLTAALALAGVVVTTLGVVQLVSGDAEIAGVIPPGVNSSLVETTEDDQSPGTTATTPATRPPTPATTAATSTRTATTPPTTSTSRATKTQAASTTRARPPRPPTRVPATTTTAVLGTTAEQPGPPTTPTSSGFRPTRNWAWAPVADADYYAVQFLRDGASLYRTRTDSPRLTLPDSVVFRPGSYRWVVRPGFGPVADGRLGAPTVDSAFVVER